MEPDERRILWRAYPKFGVADRIYLASGPAGVLLLFVDWRIGLAVLLVVVPILYRWKERVMRRCWQEYLDEAGL